MDLAPGQSLYQRVAELIENEILRGALKAQEQAPSTNQFARLYQINPATALKGLNALVDEGILYKRRGLGMYVTDDARSIIMEKRKADFRSHMIPRILKEAERLGLKKEALIQLIREANYD